MGRRKRRSLGEENLCVGEQCWAYTGQRARAVPARGCGGGGRNREIAALSQNEGQAEKTDEQIGKLLPAQATTTASSLHRDKWLIHIFFSCSNHSSNHIPDHAHPVAPAFWQTVPNTPRFPCLAFCQHSAGREKLRLWCKQGMHRQGILCPPAHAMGELHQSPPSVTLQKKGGHPLPKKNPRPYPGAGPCLGQEPTSRQDPNRFFPSLPLETGVGLKNYEIRGLSCPPSVTGPRCSSLHPDFG